ncbi:hypothetical protein [Longimicrobium sp.]|uniref:hypothetical protein n=1 Tax=Longimicrobium sp. TaxID=2029185 RepID=UPI002E310690|nr:hypothetical protein [Longimicrobium sp.]HEX6038682.1 hypothetical protein [Longimicrobium sp.]
MTLGTKWSAVNSGRGARHRHGAGWLLALLACVQGSAAAHAQRPDATLAAENIDVVHLDWVVRQLDKVPPFDEEFYLVMRMASVDSIRYAYGPRRVVSTAAGERAEIDGIVDEGRAVPHPLSRTSEYAIRVRPLDPDIAYLFRFTVYPRHPPGSPPRSVRVDVVTEATSNFGDHIMYDAGVLAAQRTGYWGLVTGVNFYALPINRDDDLSRASPAEAVLKRVSLFAGLSFRAFRAPAGMSDYYVHLGHPVLGIGVRNIPGLPGLRVGTGVMWYRQEDDNPLVVRLLVKRDVYLSLTFGPRLDDVLRRRRR